MTPASQRHPTRGLTEGAILAALTAIIGAVGLLAPPVAVLLAPLPIILLVIRWGLRIAVLACVIAAAALFQFAGPLNAIGIVLAFSSLGLALGWGARRNFAAQWTVLAGFIAFLSALLVLFGMAIVIMHQNLIGQLMKALQMSLDMQLRMADEMQRLGTPARQVEEMRQGIKAVRPLLPAILPIALVGSALFWSYTSYTVARSVLRRVGHSVPGVPAILTWRLPAGLSSIMLWAGAIFSLAAIRAPEFGGAAFGMMLGNLFVFGFQGALVGVTWANRRGYPAFLQVLFGFMLLGSGTILPVLGLAILGMLDTWWDFRRLLPREGGAGTKSDAAAANTSGGASPPDVRPAGRASKVVHQR